MMAHNPAAPAKRGKKTRLHSTAWEAHHHAPARAAQARAAQTTATTATPAMSCRKLKVRRVVTEGTSESRLTCDSLTKTH